MRKQTALLPILLSLPAFVPPLQAQTSTPSALNQELIDLTIEGTSYLHVGQFDEAIEIFTNVLEQDDTFFPAHYGLGDAYFSMDNCADAIPAYERALELEPPEIQGADPAAPLANAKLSICHAENGEYEQAVEDATRAIRLITPEISSQFQFPIGEFYMLRANAYLHLNNIEDAIADTEVALDEDGAQQVYNAAVALWQSEDYDLSQIYLDVLIRRFPHPSSGYLLRGNNYERLEEMEAAARDYFVYSRLIQDSITDIAFELASETVPLQLSANAVHFIGFTAQTGDVLNVSAYGVSDANIDTLLVLRLPSGNPFAGSDDHDPDSGIAMIEDLSLPEDGMYMLIVTHGGGLKEGEIEVRITVNEAE